MACSVSVIDGTVTASTSVSVGSNPQVMALNPVTNKLYVANNGDNDGTSGTVTVINAAHQYGHGNGARGGRPDFDFRESGDRIGSTWPTTATF